MKKVAVILFLAFAVLLPGCQGTGSAQSTDGTKPAVASSGRSYFWDSNLRPMMAVPSPSQRRARPTAAAPEARVEPVAQAPMEPVRQAPLTRPMTANTELLTTSIEQMEPVRASYAAPSYQRSVAPAYRSSTAPMYEKPMSLRPALMSVNEAGENVMSIIYPRPDYGIIQVDKTMPEEVRLNTPFSCVIKVTNLTEVMLTDVTITETLSKDFEFRGSDPTALTEANKLVWEIDSLGPKASKSIRITGIAIASRPLEHCTAITHTMRDCAVVKVVEPTLELTKIAPTEALLCEAIQVDFIVTNTGSGAAQNVQVVDNLPAGLQTADGKGKIVLEAGTLAAGESRRFSVKLRATKTGAYVNKALATSATGLKAESEATLTNVRQAILSITKSGPKRQYLGRPVAYEITIVNKGDGPAQNTIIEDIIPPGVTSVEATTGAQFSGSKLVWELGTLEPNTSKTVRVSYLPAKSGELMATATATAYCAEPVTDSARTAITGIPAVRLDVIDLEDPVEVGGSTTYVITVTNEGSASDSNIRIVCVLDDKLQYVSSAGATAGSIMGKTASFAPLRSLEPKTKATWRVVVRGAQPGDVRFKVTMHTDQLALPVEESVATHVYQQFGNN